MRFSRILFVIFAATSSLAYANPASIPVFDANTDAVADHASPGALGEVKIQSGQDGAFLAILTGDQASEAFGWRVSGLPDINGNGSSDVLVAAPGHANSAGVVGAFYAFDGNTGERLWQHVFSTDFVSGMGSILVPDQDGDGIGDILAPALRPGSNGLYEPQSILLSGASGVSLRICEEQMVLRRPGSEVRGPVSIHRK